MSSKCKICQSQTRPIKRTFRKNKPSELYNHCPFCDFIFLQDEFLISDQEEFQVYQQHENFLGDPQYTAFFMKFVKQAILDYVKKDQPRCLDFGSGPQPVLAHLLEEKFGWSVDIYDKFYAPDKIYQGKVYDLITSTEVVEHLADPLFYFKLFKELLAPQGSLAIMTLFHTTCSEFTEWFYINDPSHIAFYSKKTMQVIAELLDLKLLYCDDHRYVSFGHKDYCQNKENIYQSSNNFRLERGRR